MIETQEVEPLFKVICVDLYELDAPCWKLINLSGLLDWEILVFEIGRAWPSAAQFGNDFEL